MFSYIANSLSVISLKIQLALIFGHGKGISPKYIHEAELNLYQD